ncbi:hypothetical protein ACLESO_56725 [Pyxidicoccus sp. 3LG]
MKKGDLPEVMPRHVHRLRNLPSQAERALASVGASSEEAVIVSPGACAEVLVPWLDVFKGVVWVYSLLWPVGLVLFSLRRAPAS